MEKQKSTEDYRQTEAYQSADPSTRKAMSRWMSSCQIDARQMYLLLHREDLRKMPKEEIQNGNRPSEMMVIGAIIYFLYAVTLNRNTGMLLTGSLLVIVTSILYFSGALNPYSRALKKVNRELKSFPKTESLEEWQKKHA